MSTPTPTPLSVSEEHRRIAANMIGSWSPKASFNENLEAQAKILADAFADMQARIDQLESERDN